jgi:hypothetical protein
MVASATGVTAAANIPLRNRSAYTALRLSMNAKISMVAPNPTRPIKRMVRRRYRSDKCPQTGAKRNSDNV